ncbi:MAG: AMP-binding protein [Paludibacter sp.]
MQLIDKTLGEWLENWANKTPQNDFIVYPDRQLRFSWSEFDARVNNIANGLLSIGVVKGSHVGIWAQNVPDWLSYFFACSKLGAVVITLNTNYKAHELAFVIEDSDMQTICLTEGVPGNDYINIINGLIPELKTSQRANLNCTRFPILKNIIFIGQEKHRGMYNTSEILLLGSNNSKEKFNELKSTINCHDVVNIQYTSGTTGFPKGVMLTHHNIANNGYFTGLHMDFTPSDKLCVCVPLFHCFGVVLAVMNCLTNGCTLVMVEKFDPLITLASIHKERCTVLYGVPTMFISELNHPMFDMFDMSSLRTGIMAGALCPIELMRQVSDKMNMTITSVYGLTETSPGMTQTRITDSFETRCTTVGSEYEFVEVAVIDPITGAKCADGVQGEMCCRGYNVMKGYYKNPDATEQVIDKNGFLHSGDLGVKDADGNYRITGRIKDMIIRGGENISPREIEDFLYHMPGVKDAQVVAIASQKYGEDVGVFIIPHQGSAIVEEDVRSFCKDKIARFKIPRYIFFVNEYPLTGSGKIQKFKLREMALDICKERNITII